MTENFILESFFLSEFWNHSEFDVALACLTCLFEKGTLNSEDVLNTLRKF